MSDEKKKNPFVKWTENHAEIWKFIKFMIAGGGSVILWEILEMLLISPPSPISPKETIFSLIGISIRLMYNARAAGRSAAGSSRRNPPTIFT